MNEAHAPSAHAAGEEKIDGHRKKQCGLHCDESSSKGTGYLPGDKASTAV